MLVEKLHMIKIDSPSIELGFNILDSVYTYTEKYIIKLNNISITPFLYSG